MAKQTKYKLEELAAQPLKRDAVAAGAGGSAPRVPAGSGTAAEAGSITPPRRPDPPAESEPLADLAVTGTEPSGYRPSQDLEDLGNWLSGFETKKPGYESEYDAILEKLYAAVMDRPDFQYDFNTDPLYQTSRDQYLQAGQQAMLDTMGNAAALTGGYGSSYASTAGSQAYQGYLGQLNSLLPSFYDRAYDRYLGEGQALYDKLGLTQDLENTDYARYRDQISDYYADLNYYYTKYSDMSDQEYRQYLDNIDLWAKNREFYYNKDQDERNFQYKKKKDERDYQLRVQQSKK